MPIFKSSFRRAVTLTLALEFVAVSLCFGLIITTATAAASAAVFTCDDYLSLVGTTDTSAFKENGRQLLECYFNQHNQKLLLQTAALAGLVATIVFYLIMRRYRSMTRQLKKNNALILQQKKALENAYSELEQQNLTDELTRLPNRRHFNKAVEREHARRRRNQTPLSLLLIDIDYFKAVNDHYGHPVGDKYLQAIGRALRDSVARSTDLVARYGGEEFACLLPDTPAAGAYAIARRIQQAVARLELPNVQAQTPLLTLSIGIATLSGKSDITLERLLRETDAQLYAAKQAGRNHIMTIELGAGIEAPVN